MPTDDDDAIGRRGFMIAAADDTFEIIDNADAADEEHGADEPIEER